MLFGHHSSNWTNLLSWLEHGQIDRQTEGQAATFSPLTFARLTFISGRGRAGEWWSAAEEAASEKEAGVEGLYGFWSKLPLILSFDRRLA